MSQRVHVVAPLIAAALIAQQVASNAVRDALFLTWYQVTSLPYFMAAAAVLAIPAAEFSGRLLARFGPARVVPFILGVGALLFLIEWNLLGGHPRLASGLVYVHASVLGAIGISAFWSLLNERFDPHTAKALMARVAAAAALGGLAGGVGAERVAVLLSQGALFILLGLSGTACVAGSVFIGRGMPARPARPEVQKEEGRSGWAEIRRVPLLRDLALVVALAAALAALTDYLLKAEVVSWFGRGESLVRFFGLFYAGTAFAAFLLQAVLGRAILARIGLGGSVASHSLLVGAAGVLGFIAPVPWRAILPRGLDVTLRSSIFRAGYELFYTPLAETSKRAAKSAVDVSADCLGKGAGAALIVLLTRLDPSYAFVAVNMAGVLAAAGEFTVARRLRGRYVTALEGGLKRQAEDLQQAAPRFDFTVAASMVGLDAGSIRRALDDISERKGTPVPDDPVVAAIASLRSGDLSRILQVLRAPPTDPLLVGALVPLLANREILKQVVRALTAFGTRATAQLVDALLDPATPDIVRRRLPFVLKSCASSLARDGLVQALATSGFEVRLRCGRALLALTAKHPELAVAPHVGLQSVERELTALDADAAAREHVFNLLALVLEREPVNIAALAFDSDDTYLRGTALEYLETVLPTGIFAALAPRLSTAPAPVLPQRGAAVVRAELLEAAATMRMSRRQLLQERSAPDLDAEQ